MNETTADKRSKRNQKKLVHNFKGMETVVDSSALTLEVADMAKNVSWDTDGGISRREGSSKFNDTSSGSLDFFIKKNVGIIDVTNIDELEPSGSINLVKGDTFTIKDRLSMAPLMTDTFDGAKTMINVVGTTANGKEQLNFYINDSKLKFDDSGLTSGNLVKDSHLEDIPEISGEQVMLGFEHDKNYLSSLSKNNGAVDSVFIDDNGTYRNTTNFYGADSLTKHLYTDIANEYKTDEKYLVAFVAREGDTDRTWKVWVKEGQTEMAAYVSNPNSNRKEFIGYIKKAEDWAFGIFDGEVSGFKLIKDKTTGKYKLFFVKYLAKANDSTLSGFQLKSIDENFNVLSHFKTVDKLHECVNFCQDKNGNTYLLVKESNYKYKYKVGFWADSRRPVHEPIINLPEHVTQIGTNGQIFSGTSSGWAITDPNLGHSLFGTGNIDDGYFETNVLQNTPSEAMQDFRANYLGTNREVGGFIYHIGDIHGLNNVIKVKTALPSKYHILKIDNISGVTHPLSIDSVEIKNLNLEDVTYDGTKTIQDKFNDLSSDISNGNIITSIYAKDENKVTLFVSTLTKATDKNLYSGLYDNADRYEINATFDNTTITGQIINTNDYKGHKIYSCGKKGLYSTFIYHTEVKYDQFADVYYINSNSKYAHINDFFTGSVSVQEPTLIWDLESDVDCKVQLLDENLKIVELGDETKYPENIISLKANTVEALNNVVNTKVKYIIPIGNEDKYILKTLKLSEKAKPSSVDNAVRNAIANGEKLIGESEDIVVKIYNSGFLEVYDIEKNSLLKILSNGKITTSFSLPDYKPGDEISWTYLNDSIIISTKNNIWVLTAAKVKDGSVSIYINELSSLAEKISLLNANTFGLNVLSENPLKLLKDRHELLGTSNIFEDIIITNKKQELALVIEPNGKEYEIHPQIVIDEKAIQTLEYEWKIFALGADNQWTDKTSELLKGSNAQKEVPILTTGNSNGEYRIDCKVTVKVNGAVTETLEKSQIFNIENKTFDFDTSGESYLDAIKKCKYVTTIDGRLILYGNGSRKIYSSEPGNPYYFVSSEMINADAFGKSEPILSINTFKDTQIIFTQSTMMSLVRVYPEKAKDFWSVAPLDGVIGLTEHSAVTPIENTVAFVSDNGIYIVGQISVAEKRVQLINISIPVQDLCETFLIKNKDHVKTKGINCSNLEKRLFISFPEKEYMMVYDYNIAENIAQGKWSMWTSMVPKQMQVEDTYLYFLQDKINQNTICRKNKRKYADLKELDLDGGYFTDSGQAYEFLYVSKNSALEEPLKWKKLKRMSVTTDNWLYGTVNYRIKTTADYQNNWEDVIDNNAYRRPLISSSGLWTPGGFKLGKNLTTYRGTENVNTVTHMMSKNGLVVGISISNVADMPFSIKRIEVEYSTSNVRRFKFDRK